MSNKHPTATRLIEKQKELEALVKLNQLSHAMAIQLDQLGNQFHLTTDGSSVIESVIQRWQNVFRAAHLAFSTRSNSNKNSSDSSIDMLVRIPTTTTDTQQQQGGEEEE